MQNSKCLFNSAVALRRVFLGGMLTSDAVALQQQASGQLLPPSHRLQQRQKQAPCESRPFSTQPILFRIARNTAKRYEKEEPQNRLPRDFQIQTPFIHIIEKNGISEPLRTKDILRELDPREESLVMVAEAPRKAADGEEDLDQRGNNGRSRPQWPVCKIVNIKEERKDEYQRKKEERKKVSSSKELEINWGIAMNDLEMTKLRQLKKFLAKGMKVQISLVAKGKSRKSGKKNVASDDEAKDILKAIQAAVAEVPGSTENKIEGGIGQHMTIVYHGPANGYSPPSASAGAAASPPVAAAGAAS